MAQIKLEKTPRLKLAVRKKPYYIDIAPGVSLGYRRNQGAGAWCVRLADGNGGNRIKAFAKADDVDVANSNTILDFKQAHSRAGQLAGPQHHAAVATGAIPVGIDEAVNAYEADLLTRGGDPHNAVSIRYYLAGHDILRLTPVSLLRKKDLKDWRDGLGTKHGITADTVNRMLRGFKAALNLAASNDERIVNINSWKEGLKALPRNKADESVPRDLIMSDEMIAAFVREGYRDDIDLGRWFQTMAETGARESQILRLVVDDLQEDRGVTQLLMPSSRKGRNRDIVRKPVPISRQLFQQLKQNADGKRADDRLLARRPRLSRQFKAIAESANVKAGRQMIPYSFRHSSIVRMLMKGVPLSVVASHHDTSAPIIQRHYARFISNVSDALTRSTLPEFKAVRVA